MEYFIIFFKLTRIEIYDIHFCFLVLNFSDFKCKFFHSFTYPVLDFSKNSPFFVAQMKQIIIAIDGFSSTGKSTLAKQVAKHLGYTYVDSGAMYRAITLYFIRNNVDLTSDLEVKNALSKIVLHFDQNQICLNQENVDVEVREMRVSNLVSEVSALEAVRHFAVAQQQFLGKQKGIVMDGRDIGTTVFPDAELKIYLTADVEIRAQRRYEELLQKDASIDFNVVAENLKHRDLIDSTRSVSPLRQADDAVVLDNSALTFEQTIEAALVLAQAKINS
jgi:cytidylate kinase